MKGVGWPAVAASVSVAAVIVSVLIHVFDLRPYVVSLLNWFDGMGVWAPVLFILIDVVVVVFLLPGILLTMGAGFLFGVVKGSCYVVIATTVGAMIAFLAARFLFSRVVWRTLQAHPRAKRFDQALADDGWKFVLSTRLIPFFPFKFSNYAFGITRFSFRDFVIGTFFGIWPITMFNVYVGSITADLATLGTPGGSKSPVEWLFFGMGFAISIVVVIYTMHHARESLRQITPDPEQGKVEERRKTF